MQKQSRIVTRMRLAVCPFSISMFQMPVMPKYLFSKHLQRLPVHYRPLPGVNVYRLSNGWFVWHFPSGRRQLAALPF